MAAPTGKHSSSNLGNFSEEAVASKMVHHHRIRLAFGRFWLLELGLEQLGFIALHASFYQQHVYTAWPHMFGAFHFSVAGAVCDV